MTDGGVSHPDYRQLFGAEAWDNACDAALSAYQPGYGRAKYGDVGAAPNPGSNEAIVRGCICAVLDNNHGMFPPYATHDGVDAWYITGGCPVHDPEGDVA